MVTYIIQRTAGQCQFESVSSETSNLEFMEQNISLKKKNKSDLIPIRCSQVGFSLQ